MTADEHIPLPGPTRRIALGPHADSLCRPLEPGESVEVVNEGDRPAWLCVDAWTTRAALEATRQRDEAIGRAEAAEAEAGRLKLVLTATEHERAAAIARADNPEAEAGRLRSALVELVRLKGLKEQGGPGAMAEHDRCKRAAWHAAYAALYPGDPEATTGQVPPAEAGGLQFNSPGNPPYELGRSIGETTLDAARKFKAERDAILRWAAQHARPGSLWRVGDGWCAGRLANGCETTHRADTAEAAIREAAGLDVPGEGG